MSMKLFVLTIPWLQSPCSGHCQYTINGRFSCTVKLVSQSSFSLCKLHCIPVFNVENCSLGNSVSVLLITVGQTVSGLSGVLTGLGVTSFVLLCRFWYFMLKIILSFSSIRFSMYRSRALRKLAKSKRIWYSSQLRFCFRAYKKLTSCCGQMKGCYWLHSEASLSPTQAHKECFKVFCTASLCNNTYNESNTHVIITKCSI